MVKTWRLAAANILSTSKEPETRGELLYAHPEPGSLIPGSLIYTNSPTYPRVVYPPNPPKGSESLYIPHVSPQPKRSLPAHPPLPHTHTGSLEIRADLSNSSIFPPPGFQYPHHITCVPTPHLRRLMQAATRKGIYSAFVQLQLQSRIRRPSLLLRQVAAAAAARGFPASSSYGVIRAGCGGGVRGLSSTPRLYSTIPSGSGDKPAHADIGVRGDVIGTGSGPGTGTGDGSGSGSGSGNLVDGRSEVVGESTPRTASSEATPTANTIIAASSLTSEATNDSPSLSSDASSTATTAEESNLEISEEKTQQQDQQTQPQRESKPRGRPIGSGSTKRRQTKAKEKEFIPEPEVPAWFLENGVIMVEDNLVKSAMLECWIAPPHKDDFTRQEIVENIASHLRDGDPALNPETVEEYSELLAEQITAGTAKGTSTTETAGSFESAIPEPIPNASSPEGEVTLIQARIGRPTKVTYPVNKLVQMDGILQDKYPGVVDRASINSALTQLGESVQAQGSGLGGDLMKYLTLEGFSSSGKPSPEPELDEKTVTEPPESAEGLIKNRYAMHVYVWREIMAYITAGLALPKVSSNDSDVATKSHCILRCPRDGGIYYLDTIVEHVASLTRADIVRIDPQDLEEMAGDYLGDTKFCSYSSPQCLWLLANLVWAVSLSNITSQKIRSLGYDAQSQSQSVVVSKEDEEVEEEEEEDELADDAPSPSFFTGQIMATGAVRTMVALLPGTPASSILAPTNSQTLDSDLRNERKVYRLLEALIGSAAAKRAQKNSPGYIDPWRLDPSAPRDVAQSPETLAPLQKTIIHIRDYSELQRTPQGATIIRMMHDIVSKKRKEGIPMVIVGTTATPETSFSLTRPNMEVIQELGSDASERTVIVPPQDNVEMFEADRRARIREVNIRHLRDIIRRRSGDGKGAIELQVPKDWHLASEEDSNFPIIPGIDEDMWNFNRAHRVAVTAIGLYHKHFQSLKVGGNAAEYTPGILTMQNLVNAVEAIIQSDNYKFEWAVQEKKRLKQVEKEKEAEAAEAKTEEEEEGEGEDKSKSSQELMKKLMKNCTPHEQKLLGGVINPGMVITYFTRHQRGGYANAL